MANPNLPSTIPSTLAPVVQSYTPSVQSPAFSSIVNEVYAPVTYTTAGNITLLPSDVLGGFITHTAAGAENDVLPAASLLIPAIQGAQVGSGIRFFLKAGGAGTITAVAGTGGTIVGTATVATLNIREFLLQITALGDVNAVGATYTAYSLGTTTY